MKVLKKIFIIVGIFILLAAVGLFFFIKTFDINKYREQIVNEISRKIHREASIKQLALVVNIKQGVSLRADDFAIMDDPAISKETFFKAQYLLLKVDISVFLKQKKMVVTDVEVKDPSIHLIRSKEGALNVPIITSVKTGPAKAGEAEAAENPLTSAVSSNSKGNDMIQQITISSLRLLDGTVSFEDRQAEPPLQITLQHIDFKAENVNFENSFPFQLALSLWSSIQNIKVNGTAQINQAKQEIQLSSVQLKTLLDDMDVKQMEQSLPALASLQIEGNMKGQVRFDINQLIAGQKGLTHLEANGGLSDGKMSLAMLKSPLDSIEASFDMNQSDVHLTNFSLHLASGKVTGTAVIEHYLDQQTFHFKRQMENVQIGELLDQTQWPAKIVGLINGEIEGGGQGFQWPQIESNLTAKATLRVDEGKILGVNVLRLVVTNLSRIPGLGQNIEAGLSPEEKTKLEREDTVLNRVESQISIQQGKVLIEQAMVDADDFMMNIDGSVDFDRMADITATFYLPVSISTGMVASAPPLKGLLDAQGRLAIPAVPYEGPAEKMKLLPDISTMGKMVIQDYGRQELEKVLRKAIGAEEEPSNPPQGTETAPPNETQPEQRPEDILIDSVFNAIFKK